MKTVSFIIISYNRPEDTIEAVKSILAQDGVNESTEIIVINNDSELSYSVFEQFLSTNNKARSITNYIEADENLGVARGRNLGIQKSSGDLLIFIDDDAVFKQNNIIEVTQNLFSKYQNLGIVAYNEYLVKEERYNKATKSKSLIDKDEFFTSYFIGCGHAISRQVIDSVGLYRKDTFYGMEEYDLSYRTLQNGFSIYYTSHVEVLHMKNPMGRQNSYQVSKMLTENKTVIAYRYLPILYFLSHYVFWTGRLFVNHPSRILKNIQTTFGLIPRLSKISREPLSTEAMSYVRKVKGRLWY